MNNTETKHTAGPWRLVRDQSGWYVSPVEATLPFFDLDDQRGSEYEANAHLIAAAPELLAALKSCAAVCAGETMTKGCLIEALEQARAAIAKAEGSPSLPATPEAK